MNGFFSLVKALLLYKKHAALSVLFYFLTALFTVVSIPVVIPFFQLLFDSELVGSQRPDSWWEIEGFLSFKFGQLISAHGRERSLMLICGVMVCLFLVRNVMRYLASHYLVFARNGVLRDLRRDLYQSFQRLSQSDRKHYKKGQLVSMMTNDMIEIDHGMLKAVELIFKVPLIVIGSLILMFWISAKLTMIALVLVIFTLIVIGRLSHTLKNTSTTAQHILGEMSALSDEYLSASRLIKTYGADSFFSSRFSQYNDAHFSLSNSMLRRRDLASPLSEFLAVLIITSLLWYGAHLVFDGEMYAPSFFAFVFAFYSIVDPAKSFAREYYNVQKAHAALERVQTFSSRHSDLHDDIVVRKGIMFSKGIELRDITFQYDDGESPVFKNLNLYIRRGERLGIVGASGVGKTTLLDILLRYYQLSEGQILLDDQPIEQYSTEQYRQLFGIVTQDTHLFHMSLSENVALSTAEVAPEVWSAAQVDFLDREQIGDGGAALSGGQRQRLAIARIFHHDRDIVLLDEPTTALDSDAEESVLGALYELLVDRTILMISHDVRLLRHMDRIIEIDRGRVAREGTYEELYGDDFGGFGHGIS